MGGSTPLIMEREPPTRIFAGVLLLVIAVGHIDFGYGAYDSSTFTWCYQLWPLLFGAAAGSCLLAALRFTPRNVALSGSLTVVAYCSRAAVIVMSEVSGHSHLGLGQILFGMGAWLMLAGYAGALWLRGYGPLAHLWARVERAA